MTHIDHANTLDDEAKSFAEAQWECFDHEQFDGDFRRESVAIVARDGDEVVGTATGWMCMGVAYLSELIVEAGRRGSGIGSKLLAEFEERARAAGQLRLALRTPTDAQSRDFYEGRGWYVESQVENWIGGKTFAQMRKDLTPAAR